ncbi:HD domain-containing protein [Dyadobacter bucti]|uniref:HD domain-containing protein n=1 Tax=Dyadobacter bucti TaxID=2572203 RepID=UPI001108FACC|nr:HD domain-containing protein [Dyadobacter bucti]
MEFERAEAYILDRLRTGLADSLYYHGLHHTLDVAQAASALAEEEGISENEDLILLKTASLYHDCGFLYAYQGHEAESCRIAAEVLPDFGYKSEQIAEIVGMITATKLPQSPQTHLEQIICDADLDYLGREDYWPVAETLFQELKKRGLIEDPAAWIATQIRFLETHQYWTASARKKRDALKQQHLDRLSKSVGR